MSWWQGAWIERRVEASLGTPDESSGGCPILFIPIDKDEYISETLIDIHAELDVKINYTLTQLPYINEKK